MARDTPVFDPYYNALEGFHRHVSNRQRGRPRVSLAERLDRWKRREKLRFAVAEAGRRTAREEGEKSTCRL